MYRLLLIATVLLAACGDAHGGSADPGDGRPRVHSVSEDGDTAFLVKRDDAEMERARERARCTLSEFRRRFRDPPATQTQLSLKGIFQDEESTEHLWLDVLAVNGDTTFVGTVANDPGMVRSVAFGDTVTIGSAQVSDWQAVDRDTLVAGFTTRILMGRKRGGEPAGQDTTLGYKIDSDEHAWRRLERFCVPARL